MAGPFFISIGDREKLVKFLELNPKIPRDKAFVDDYKFKAYNTMGLKSISDMNKEELMKGFKQRTAKLGGFRGWWQYISNAAALSPIDKSKSGIPEGVLRLGGTFVVSGDDIVYQWNDKVPGDHPDPSAVLDAVTEQGIVSGG